MPYLTIKHETGTQQIILGWEEKSSVAHQIEVVVHQIKRLEMCARALSVANAQLCRVPTRKHA